MMSWKMDLKIALAAIEVSWVLVSGELVDVSRIDKSQVKNVLNFRPVGVVWFGENQAEQPEHVDVQADRQLDL